jgi:hypothetical protein
MGMMAPRTRINRDFLGFYVIAGALTSAFWKDYKWNRTILLTAE